MKLVFLKSWLGKVEKLIYIKPLEILITMWYINDIFIPFLCYSFGHIVRYCRFITILLFGMLPVDVISKNIFFSNLGCKPILIANGC